MSQTKIKIVHEPVLLREVLETLAPKEGERYLDLTAGYGGHASAILEQTNSSAVLVDRDENAIAVLTDLSSQLHGISLLHLDFLTAAKKLVADKEKFDIILIDLGVSSPHLDKAERGFSLATEGPLDMRMDNRQEVTAAHIVNEYDEAALTKIIREYGEEPKARAMARLIIASRPLHTTTELAAIAKRVWTGHSRVHPATRLFQAIRIEVNNELELLKQLLPLLVELLNPNGRVGIIAFHSLEDRIVKQFFKEHTADRYDAELRAITKGPITASPQELVINPRSRSAKMRVVAKIKTKEGEGYSYADSGKN